jgi:SpoVK/Ycf46/Vps4 family AAA+-type ATPase
MGWVDEAILRRLPQVFEIGIPDQRERAEILKVVLKGEKIESNIVLNDLILSIHALKFQYASKTLQY